MAEKKSAEKKKAANILQPLTSSFGSMSTTVVNKIQSLGKIIPNPFRSSHAKFEDGSEDDSSERKVKKKSSSPTGSLKLHRPLGSSPSSIRTARLPVQIPQESKLKNSRDLLKKSPSIPAAKKTSSREKRPPKQNTLDPDHKLREEVIELANELSRLENFDQSKELFDSMKVALDELHFFDQMFRGAKQSIRNQFKNIAAEIQADKEYNWKQMMNLETAVGQAMEEQKILEKELDLIIVEMQKLEQLAQKEAKEKKDGKCSSSSVLLILGALAALIGCFIYRRTLLEGIPSNDQFLCASLSTVGRQSRPSSRIVQISELAPDGFIFFGHRCGTKGLQMEANPNAALLFYWPQEGRQVRVEGMIVTLPKDEAEKNWEIWPISLRAGVSFGGQSTLISEEEFIKRKSQLKALEPTEENFPRPETWIGFKLVPRYFEFFTKDKECFNERIVFKKDEEGLDNWFKFRICP